MTAIAIIPARMGSSRFPGKPLAKILGRPMLQWVYEGTATCSALSAVYVATCDREIEKAARGFGATVIMTSPRHERASDRTAEAAASLTADSVVMVQGDEPMVVPGMIDEAIAPFADPNVLCTNLASPISTEEEFRDPNTVKVVSRADGDAMYFSREPIPSLWQASHVSGWGQRQVCVIGFRRDFLLRYTAMPQTLAERKESIDMLRILEHGLPVRIVPTRWDSRPVDNPDDLRAVETLLRHRAGS